MADVIPPKTEIKSQPPDVIVSVGTGDSKQDFECYKVVLAFASPYLDAMLSSEMKEGESGRVEFPMKDPEEWKLFYAFFGPQNIGQGSQAVIDSENVLQLLPWFHEFQMDYYVKVCDTYLAEQYFEARFGSPFCSESDEENHRETTKQELDAALHVLHIAHMYGLVSSKGRISQGFACLMGQHCANELFDFATIESLLKTIQPLALEGDELMMKNEGGSRELWSAFKTILSPHIPHLSQEMIDNKEAFPVIVHSYAQHWFEKKKAESAKNIILTVVNSYQLGFNVGTSRKKFRGVVKSHFEDQKIDFKNLGIGRLPSVYDKC